MTETRLPETSLAHDDEGYLLDVNEVAALLGVTRTRVSQLTSAGQLSFERRRVGARNRLFYRRSEVLAHQRTFYGRHIPGSAPSFVPASQEFSEFDENGFVPDASSPVRVGAFGQPAARTSAQWPEQLLVEMSRLFSREQTNADLLVKIRELTLQIQAHVSAPERKPLSSALELDAREDTIKQFKSLDNALVLLRGQLHSQERLMGQLFLEIAELKKVVLQLRHEGLKSSLPRALPAAAPAPQSERAVAHLEDVGTVDSSALRTPQRKRSIPRVARTAVRKNFSSR
ncbi:MAG: hypothetical protein RI932_1315 [Pseudomonadota bacterium]|jgi:hypothetical protein